MDFLFFFFFIRISYQIKFGNIYPPICTNL
jgi:hypothetical protein